MIKSHDGKVLENQDQVLGNKDDKADFSYKEKDLVPDVSKGLNKVFKDFALAQEQRHKVSVNMVSVYGEAFQSSSRAPKYKGNVETKTIFNVRLEFKWYGRVFLGDATLGSSSGKIKVSEIDNESIDTPEKWEFTTKLDVEAPPGGYQQGQEPIPPSDIDNQLKKVAMEHGPDKIRPLLHNALKEMLVNLKFQDLQNPAIIDQDEEKETGTKTEDFMVNTEDLRRQLLGAEYLRVIDGNAKNEPEWKLRLCTIHDRDMDALCKSIRENDKLESLDLYFNYISDAGVGKLVESIKDLPNISTLDLRHNKIGDTGVQLLMGMLAVGGAPKLKMIDVSDNPEITEVGKTIISGLSLMRQDMKINL